MAILLGFGEVGVKATQDTVSPYVADITAALNMIYVYCGIVQSQVVGDVNANLLRTVPIEGEVGEVITRTYSNIQYVAAQTKYFEYIEILLRDDTGNPLPFEHGRVITTLHFQRQNSPYFT